MTLLRTLLHALAAHERALIPCRTMAALGVRKAKGERTGGVPHGWRAEGKRLVPAPAEQAAVARARELRAEGKSLRGVAAGLVEEGRRPRSGGAWAIQTVRRIVAPSSR